MKTICSPAVVELPSARQAFGLLLIRASGIAHSQCPITDTATRPRRDISYDTPTRTRSRRRVAAPQGMPRPQGRGALPRSQRPPARSLDHTVVRDSLHQQTTGLASTTNMKRISVLFRRSTSHVQDFTRLPQRRILHRLTIEHGRKTHALQPRSR